MTTWLWAIGALAILWPVIVAFYLDSVFTKWLNLIGSKSETSQFADQRAEANRRELRKIQAILEQHESLVVALWQRTFGFSYDDRFSEAALPEYLGVKPNWQGFTRELHGAVNYVVRYEPFPWGTSAEHLNIGD